MSPVSSDELIAVVQRSHLLTADQIHMFRERLASTWTTLSPADTAAELVRQDLLTQWQADRLLIGSESFFLGKYRLLRPLGQGGMGAVFQAEHPGLRRVVALKILDRKLSENPESIARFYREIEAVASLQHPNVVEAFDAGAVGPDHYLVMEFVNGEDLGELLKRQPVLPVDVACDYIRQAAEGLQYVHQQGMVHRDIKPGNLFLARRHDRTVVKILDMGLATFGELAREDGSLTHTGQIMGTPDYIAPEQAIDSKSVDIRADIFSLGCTLYRMLTGQLPFPGKSVMEKLMARAQTTARPVSVLRPDLPPALASLIARMIARSPDDRPATPGEIAGQLQSCLRAYEVTVGATELDGTDATVILAATEQAPAPTAKPVTPPHEPQPSQTRPDAAFDQFLSGLTSSAMDGTSVIMSREPEPPAATPVPVAPPSPAAVGPAVTIPARKQRPRTGLWIAVSTGAAFAIVAGLLLLFSSQARARLRFDWPVDERESAELQINDRDFNVPSDGEILLEFPDGGRFEVIATRPGFRPFSSSEIVGRGELRSVTLKWTPTAERLRKSEFAKITADAAQLRTANDVRIPDGDLAVAARRRILKFQRTHPVTVEAIAAADLLSSFKWPVDQLDRSTIPAEQLRIAGEGDPSRVPDEVVAIFGDGRLMHSHGLVDMKYSPDGRMLATVGGDHTIRVWDTSNGDMIAVLRATERTGGDSCAFSPDSRQLVVSAWDRLLVWNAESWQIDAEYAETGPQKSGLVFDSQGRLFAATLEGRVQVWQLGDKAVAVQEFEVGGDMPAFAISPDDRLIAIGNTLGKVQILSAEDSTVLCEVSLPYANGAMYFSRSGEKLVTSGGGAGIRCWDVRDPANPIELCHFPLQNSAADFSADGQRVYATGWGVGDPVLTAVDTTTGAVVGVIGDNADGVARGVLASPDGSSIATTSYSGVRFWDLETGREKFVDNDANAGPRHRDRLVDLDVSSDGTQVVSTALDMSIVTRSMATGSPTQLIRGSLEEMAGGIACSPDGSMFAYGDGSRLVFAGDRRVPDWSGIGRVHGPYHHIEFTTDGQHVAAATALGVLRIRDVATGRLRRQIEAAVDFAFRADGMLAVSHNEPARISVYRDNGLTDLKTIEMEHELTGPLTFAPHGNKLACSLYSNHAYTIEVWDVEKRRRLRKLGPYRTLSFGTLAFSLDGRFLARMLFEGKLIVWDLDRMTDSPALDIPVCNGSVWCPRIRFTPDGRHILLGNGNGTIYVVRLPIRLTD